MHDGQGALEYAQLMLLFRARLPRPPLFDLAGDWQQLAYVRWFRRASTHNDKLARYGAVPLRWDMLPNGPANQQAGVRCGVIPLTSISQRVHVVPVFEAGTATPSGTYYVNPFMY
jgi:hypothetical protein